MKHPQSLHNLSSCCLPLTSTFLHNWNCSLRNYSSHTHRPGSHVIQSMLLFQHQPGLTLSLLSCSRLLSSYTIFPHFLRQYSTAAKTDVHERKCGAHLWEHPSTCPWAACSRLHLHLGSKQTTSPRLLSHLKIPKSSESYAHRLHPWKCTSFSLPTSLQSEKGLLDDKSVFQERSPFRTDVRDQDLGCFFLMYGLCL